MLLANFFGALNSNMTTAAGQVSAKVAKLGADTKLTSSAGTIELTAYEVGGNVKISTAAGNATVYMPAHVNCRINAKKPSIGSMYNELVGNPSSPYTLKASSSIGSVRLIAIVDDERRQQ